MAIIKNPTNIIAGGGNKLNQLLTDSLTEITKKDLEGVTTIPPSFFSGQGNLTKVEIPSTVETISRSAFSSCPNITTILLENGLKFVYASAFECACAEITFPATVEEMGADAFESTVAGGAIIHMKAADPPRGNTGVTYRDPFPYDSVNKMYVPVGSAAAYKDHYIWDYLADKIFEE